MDYSLLGKRIKEERLKLNLTQEKLAEYIDISLSFMGQIERGERNLSLDTLVKLANRLGVTVDYLLCDSVKIVDDNLLTEVTQLMTERTSKEKRMLLDLIKVTLTHIDMMNEK